MKKIFQLSYSLHLAGTEMVIMNWYRHLDHQKFCFDFGITHKEPIHFKQEIESYGGRIFFIPRENGLLGKIKFLMALYRTLKQNGPYAAFHTHDHYFAGVVCMVAWLAGIKNRLSISHYADGVRCMNATNRLVKIVARLFLFLFTTKRLAVSAEAGFSLYGKYLSFDTIHNGIDLDLFGYNPIVREQTRQKMGWQQHFVVGHIGRFEEQKNHRFLIDIFYEIHQKNPAALLVLIGCGSLEEEIQKKVQSLGLEKEVLFLGTQSHTTEYYQAFDCFVFPSLFEGLGIVLIEAQASGLPCFASDAIPAEAFAVNAYPLSLGMSASSWAETILEKVTNFSRENQNMVLGKKGFGSKGVAQQIQRYYNS